MITEIEIERFKSLEKVRLTLGGLNLFIGANGTGKSNFFDALRVLQGIGYGFTVDEIFNGKPKSTSSEVWEGLRGGSALAVIKKRRPRAESFKENLVFLVSGLIKDQAYRYRIEMSPTRGWVDSENLAIGPSQLFEEVVLDDWAMSYPGYDVTHIAGISQVRSAGSKPKQPCLQTDFLQQLSGGVPLDSAKKLIRGLRNMQHLAPLPSLLRGYAQAKFAPRMGERGENFAALVREIVEQGLKSDYLSWLTQLTPIELDDLKILRGALGEYLFALKKDGEVLPAPILSDGTLRFAAITAAFFQPDMPGIITLEEIENGIHPSRLRLLLELLKSQSGGSGPQVFATTHSPVVLAWLDEKDYETTFLCKRDEETGASIITPLSEIPHLIDLVRKQPIGELFTEGWLEGAF